MIHSICVKEVGISRANSCCFHLHNKASRGYTLIIIQLLKRQLKNTRTEKDQGYVNMK